MFRCLIILAICVCYCGASLVYNSSYILSCYQAGNSGLQKPDLCSSATWRTARLYDSPLSIYSEDAPYSPSVQNEFAQKVYDEIMLLGQDTDSDSCTTAIQWLTCAEAFPFCPVPSLSMSSITYLLPCKWHCNYVTKLCGVELDCSGYNDFSTCSIYVPDGYFYIPPEKVCFLSDLCNDFAISASRACGFKCVSGLSERHPQLLYGLIDHLRRLPADLPGFLLILHRHPKKASTRADRGDDLHPGGQSDLVLRAVLLLEHLHLPRWYASLSI